MNLTSGDDRNVKEAVPFFSVSDIEASVRYYVDGLGFEIVHRWIDGGRLRWCRLQLGGAALMLQQFRTEGPDAWVPAETLGAGIAIYFICDNALAIHRVVTARGIEVDEPFVGNAMWVVGMRDPDGYQLFFESPTDVPEETVLSAWAGA